MMWHEARKQEKKIRCMLVDYQRRAQRRKDYYDKIKSDPTQFLQLHGRSCRIHLDPAVCVAANSAVTMMPWQGNPEVLIDRFDARAHLDYIPEVTNRSEPEKELSYEERQTNYERYRILVQNDFFNIPEGKFLHQIHLEEKFGSSLKTPDESNGSKKRSTAAIGYNYDEEDTVPSVVDKSKNNVPPLPPVDADAAEENDSDSDIDLDLTVDVSKIETQQANELNTCAHAYGMITNDFFSFLNDDLEEAENLRIAREEEEEKAMFSGRKSRKERRAFRERTLIHRRLSPPSYAWRKSPSYEDYKALVSSNRSRSKSTSPQNSGKITYITSFGDDEPVASSSTSKDAVRKKISRSRSSSRDVERSRRARRSRSASAGRRKRSDRNRRSRSSSRGHYSRTKLSSRKLDSRSSPYNQPRSVSETVPVANSPPSFADNSVSAGIPRYYGRKKEQSSSELSLSSSDDEASKQNRADKSKSYQVSGPCRVAASNKNSSSDKLTPQERLRRKRQVMLNKQFKADKRAEREKVAKQVQERIERAEEMKEISIKLRRRQRMLRHSDSPRQHSSRSNSSSSDRSSASKSSYSRRSSKHSDKRRTQSSSGSSSDASESRDDKQRGYRRNRNSVSRSRSRSHSRSSRSHSRQRSRSPRPGRYSEERDSRRTNIRQQDRDSNKRRYCTLSEERELARVHMERRDNDRRDEYKNDHKSRRERSPPRGRLNNGGMSDDRMRDRIRERDRSNGASRSRFSGRRSSSRDRYFSRFDH